MNRKNTLIIAVVFGMVLITQYLATEFFPGLTFVNGNLRIANLILGYLAFSGFILCIPIVFRAGKALTIPLGIILFLIFFISSCATIYPIDTITQPKDLSILNTYENGCKLIVREYKNAKTDHLIRDTVLIKDTFLFRQIIKSGSNR